MIDDDPPDRDALLAEAEWLVHAKQAAGSDELDPGETARLRRLLNMVRVIDGQDPVTDPADLRAELFTEAEWLLTRYNAIVAELRAMDNTA
jgi:hypothetical protein